MRVDGLRMPWRVRVARANSSNVGASVGSIMPAIIAAHIAHSRSSRGASQVTVIIHAEAPVIGPYMSRAMATTHAQHASGRMATRTTSVSDGRPSAASMTVFKEGYCGRKQAQIV